MIKRHSLFRVETMLKKMSVENFTVFTRAEFNFAKGLNVIIGENGCGKSHVLKTAYAVIAASEAEGNKQNSQKPVKATLQRLYAEKLLNVLRPDALGHLVSRRAGQGRCKLNFKFYNRNGALDCAFSFSTSSKSEVKIDKANKSWQDTTPVFLPTRELLSIYPGFVYIYNKSLLQYDESYRDTCELLGAPALRGPRAETTDKLLQPLEEAIGGKVILEGNDRFYLKFPGKGKMEMHLVAGGGRKLAMLARLVATGILLDKGYLFWDEPETNPESKIYQGSSRSNFAPL